MGWIPEPGITLAEHAQIHAGGAGGDVNVTYVDSALTSSLDTGDTNVAVTIPAGTGEDDTVIVFAFFRNSFNLGPDDTGWNRLLFRGATDGGVGLESADDNFGVWMKTYTSTPPSSVDWGVDDNGTDGQRWMAVAVRGMTGVEDVRVNLGTLGAPSVKGTAGGLLICAWGSLFENGTWNDPPGDMTERLNGNSGFNDTRVMLATKALSTTGQTGDKVPTHTNMNAWLISISMSLV